VSPARYRVYLDPDPDPPLVASPCDGGGNHTPTPRGFLERVDWVAQMQKTHRVRRCPHCGRWAIWTPKDDDR
jgi:hypothetical protein